MAKLQVWSQVEVPGPKVEAGGGGVCSASTRGPLPPCVSVTWCQASPPSRLGSLGFQGVFILSSLSLLQMPSVSASPQPRETPTGSPLTWRCYVTSREGCF